MDRKQVYSEKLRDPRWQKRRLEILERDAWQCQACLSTAKTLHVHHLCSTGLTPSLPSAERSNEGLAVSSRSIW